MTTVSVTNTTILRALSYASAATEALEELKATAVSPNQLDLFDEGANRACEEFVRERAELKEALNTSQMQVTLARTQLRQELDSHRVYTQGLRSQIDALTDKLAAKEEADKSTNEVLLALTDYANKLQAGLNDLGIQHAADPVTGDPSFSVNPGRMIVAAQAALSKY